MLMSTNSLVNAGSYQLHARWVPKATHASELEGKWMWCRHMMIVWGQAGWLYAMFSLIHFI